MLKGPLLDAIDSLTTIFSEANRVSLLPEDGAFTPVKAVETVIVPASD